MTRNIFKIFLVLFLFFLDIHNFTSGDSVAESESNLRKSVERYRTELVERSLNGSSRLIEEEGPQQRLVNFLIAWDHYRDDGDMKAKKTIESIERLIEKNLATHFPANQKKLANDVKKSLTSLKEEIVTSNNVILNDYNLNHEKIGKIYSELWVSLEDLKDVMYKEEKPTQEVEDVENEWLFQVMMCISDVIEKGKNVYDTWNLKINESFFTFASALQKLTETDPVFDEWDEAIEDLLIAYDKSLAIIQTTQPDLQKRLEDTFTDYTRCSAEILYKSDPDYYTEK